MFYGYGEDAILEVKRKVIEAIRDLECAEDTVLTRTASTVETIEGDEALPYIRVCGTEQAELDEILNAFHLAKLGEDVETLLLAGFDSIPGE